MTRGREFIRAAALCSALALGSLTSNIVAQDEKAWTLSLDMPGVAREDLEIDIEGAVVRIATRAEAKRPYQAAYELPEEIDAPASSAKLENGVLTLVLGKKQPVSTARRIEVS